MAICGALQTHLESGLTTLCRAWSITRKDAVSFGFTDHDCMLEFDGQVFRADTGLSALALQQSTGLSVDNTEALGALCDASLTEEDILAGRFDGAEIKGWLVNWAAPDERELIFRGTMGEITRIDGAFRAEVRGLTEALNRPFGRVIQRSSSDLLDDAGRPFDLHQTGYVFEGSIAGLDGRAGLVFDTLGAFADGWFQHGSLTVLGGPSAGLKGVIKSDMLLPGGSTRRVELWEPLRAPLSVGDRVQLLAGNDGSFQTCRFKFDNGINFRGFPDVPDDDWVITAAPSAGNTSGGSRR